MKEPKFRKLKADEIDCRIATVKKTGLSLLLYKDARVDQNILDETVGAMNWQRRHTRDNANCIVSLWDEDKKIWIEKEDTGTESYTEKEKGLASDSFKRACFNWGIGRELYTAPFIWIKSKDCEIKEVDSRKFTCYDKFFVSSIGYDDAGSINELTIRHENTHNIVYRMNASKQAEPEPPAPPLLTKAQVQTLNAECARTGVGRKGIYQSYGVNSFEQMNVEHFRNAMDILRAKPDKPIDPATIPPDNDDSGLPWSNTGESHGK